ncbi:MAG TPA: hypothetical protein VFE28_01840 [Candidatus Krumholzibacteria bacterium]|nr:hypothetical protein [Candidatus Krumholzibacteria bacterium]
MIPGKIQRFLEEYANVATSGSRDRDLVPYGHRVIGWRIGADRDSLICLVPAQFTDQLVDNLTDNGQYSVTIEEFPSHETYQFKGRYLRHRDPEPQDHAAHARIVARFQKGVRTMFPELPEQLLRDYMLEPALAVEIQVEEIFLQTPGPGAGTRLVPPVGAGGA